MDISAEEILTNMLESGAEAFGDGWAAVKDYAPIEFKKISAQIIEILENIAKFELDNSMGFSAETGKALMGMQRRATEDVLIAMSTLTLIAVQGALNAMFDVLKQAFQGALASLL